MVMAGMGMVALVGLTLGSRTLLTNYTGVDESLRLQAMARAVGRKWFADEPPARVSRALGTEEGRGWRWHVEATLRPSAAGSALERSLGRLAQRCASTLVQGGRATGTRMVLHLPDGGTRTLEFDARGNPVEPPVTSMGGTGTPVTAPHGEGPAGSGPAGEPASPEEER